jgi:assimilatory nitrate reductase catalytic subunit
VGFYISGQLLTEDYYVFNKLAKGLIGTNNVDTNSRLCMSSAVAGYKATLGADAPPACYDDLKFAQTLFIVGSNTAYAHPILFRRIEDARRDNPAMKLIVADPRRTETAEVADLYLPIQPGTDVALFHGMLHLLMWEGLIDNAYIRAHTTGFDELKAIVRDFTPKEVAKLCGIGEADLVQAAKWFGESPATLSLYCQGLNQSSSGTDKNAALINLHLATGQIGKPGAGPFSLTGQPNAMGGREVGGLANLLSGHRDMANPEHRAEVAALWGVPDVPATPGKTAVEMFEAAARGEIKALWIACTNPAQSMPDQATVRKALQTAEFVVVQEAFATTATCAFADLLLPATTWGEKEGTVTNSERRISRVRPAVGAPGAARDDWAMVVDFARRLEQRLPERVPQGLATLFPYDTAEAVWNEHRESTRGHDLDITGLSYALLETAGPQQWPMPEGASEGKLRLYEDGVFPTPDGRARFVAMKYKPVAEPRDARYPFSLTTGRLRDQWHGMSRTGRAPQLFAHSPEPSLRMHPDDAARRGLIGGELVRVTSARGELVLPLEPNDEVGSGTVFAAMHWSGQYLSSGGINEVSQPATDTRSLQPELKHAAVRVEKAGFGWHLIAARRGDVQAMRTALQPLLKECGYAGVGLHAQFNGPGDDAWLVLRAAAAEPMPSHWLAALDRAMALAANADTLEYRDARRGLLKRVAWRADAGQSFIDGVLWAGAEPQAAAESLLRYALSGQAWTGPRLAAFSSAIANVARDPVVCLCRQVTESAIRARVAQGADVPALKQQLGCGTVCGSCIPQLTQYVARASGAHPDSRDAQTRARLAALPELRNIGGNDP